MRPAVSRCTHCQLSGVSSASYGCHAASRVEERRHGHCHHAAQWSEVAQHAHVLGSMCTSSLMSDFLPVDLPVLPSKLITVSAQGLRRARA